MSAGLGLVHLLITMYRHFDHDTLNQRYGRNCLFRSATHDAYIGSAIRLNLEFADVSRSTPLEVPDAFCGP